MSFLDKMKDAGEDIKDAFTEGAQDLAEKAGDLKDAAMEKAGDIKDAVAEKAALSKKDAEAAVTAALDAVAAALAEGDEVRLVGFGTFEVKKREARMGRNPKTKEEIQIPATKVPAFKPGKALKDIVAK